MLKLRRIIRAITAPIAARISSALMCALSVVWWFENHEIEPIISAVGFLVAFLQTFRPPADPGELKRTELTIKQKLQEAFPRTEIEWQAAVERPAKQWESGKVIVRSLADDTYPGSNQRFVRGVYSWFGSEVYSFYHNGIMVFRSIVPVVLDDQGNWAVVDATREQHLDPFQQARAYHLGCIPFGEVADVDAGGDEYYPYPQIFCRYEQNGTPYEDERFVLIGEQRDEPLFEAHRFHLEG